MAKKSLAEHKQKGIRLQLSQIKSYIIPGILRQSVQRVCGGPSPRHCARAIQLLSKKCCRGGEPLAILSDLTNPRFKSQICRSRDKRATARSTGRLHLNQK